ncbi:MAG: transcription termination/antitermination NusG family protein [Planctomycetaceae bacterium]
MPILDWEPPLWPENLLDRELVDGPASAPHWWAVHVRPRSEKMLARKLLARRVGYYLPQHELRKTYQRRIVTSRVPVFPGYVFVCGDDAAFEFSSTAREVVSPIRVVEQNTFVAQLRDVRRLIDSGAPITPEEKLETGMPARIVRGPLAGMSGHVVRNKRGLKFVLQVQFIQRAASIEVDGTMVEAI